jgi:Formate--tetrahydrofolate ligase
LIHILFSSTDSNAELEAIRVAALEAGADAAIPSWHWGEGGKGAIELAKAVVDTCNSDKQSFRYLYDLKGSIEDKVGIVAKEIYGADSIELSDEAQKKVALYEKQVFPFLHPFSNLRDLAIFLSASPRHSILFLQIRTPRVCQQGLKFPSGISGFLEVLGL